MPMSEVMSYVTLLAVLLGVVVNIVGLLSRRDAEIRANATRDSDIAYIRKQVDTMVKGDTLVAETLAEHTTAITRLQESTGELRKQFDELSGEHKQRCFNTPAQH